MKTVHIIYKNYLNPDEKSVSIGGIQTYIGNLCDVFNELGYNIFVYQMSDHNFECGYKNIMVRGYGEKIKDSEIARYIFSKMKVFVKGSDLIIFGSEQYCCSTPGFCSIAIQHGITWDKPSGEGSGQFGFLLGFAKKAVKSWKIISRVGQVENIVCVDHNFPNWYRAMVSRPSMKLKVITNFTEVPSINVSKHDDHLIRIIFARRLFEYRGTKVFVRAIKMLLDDKLPISVTIAGDGPDENWMKQELSKYENVSFIHYKSEESLRIHSEHHVAVVPTVGSEGTSLSLLEAMASSCAVVCSDVGGMTDIVIDKYNGLMCGAGSVEELAKAITYLVQEPNQRKKLAQKGYETVRDAFSLERWKKEWTGYIEHIERSRNK